MLPNAVNFDNISEDTLAAENIQMLSHNALGQVTELLSGVAKTSTHQTTVNWLFAYSK